MLSYHARALRSGQRRVLAELRRSHPLQRSRLGKLRRGRPLRADARGARACEQLRDRGRGGLGRAAQRAAARAEERRRLQGDHEMNARQPLRRKHLPQEERYPATYWQCLQQWRRYW